MEMEVVRVNSEELGNYPIEDFIDKFYTEVFKKLQKFHL